MPAVTASIWIACLQIIAVHFVLEYLKKKNKKKQKLVNCTFNKGLLSSKDPADVEDSKDDLYNNDTESTGLTNTNLSNAEEYCTRSQSSQKGDNMLNHYAAIPRPSHTDPSTNNYFNAVQNTSCTSKSSPGPFHVTDITSGEQIFGNKTIFYKLIF